MSQVEDIGIQKEENKLKMSIAMFIVFLVTVFIMYIIGKIDVEKIGVEKIEVLLPYFIFIPIVVPFGGALFVDKILKKVNEKKEANRDSWSNNSDGSDKVKKIRNSKFKETQYRGLSKFTIILSMVISYLSIYFSAVLIFTENIVENNPKIKFFDVFIELFKNMFIYNEIREQLFIYFIFITVFYAIFIIESLWKKRKNKRS
ncbi:hypothetical protein [Fusobacterium pseudoperiodonticum]|uniref:hypothetical protein n=1 Tax=Fusobacterium pseudoperiodonticum TaxID=2663009 RepID=UPI000C1C06AA|nr:hypothetical protein [Fusobacterium pseudoperiodonticum]ATV63172.1 hypothetical protein CTM78_01425 [Fusobacterium pseudoperiodonticum]